MRYLKNEKGSMSLETALVLPVFIMGFTAIIIFAMFTRAETVVQYSIDQVSKEISEYLYVAERLNLIDTSTSNEGVKDIDNTVESIVDFANIAGNAADNISNMDLSSIEAAIESVKGVKNDAAAIKAAGENLYGTFSALMKNPTGSIKAFVAILKQQVVSEVMSRVLAQPICRILIPKYITTDRDPNTFLKSLGVVEGIDGINFGMSSILRDQRTVTIVAVYRLKITLGPISKQIVVKQTASTAAWVKGTSLKEAAKKASKWELPDTQRGKEFVSELSEKGDYIAINNGKGIDLYDSKTNTFISIHSINVFASTYSQLTGDESDPNGYDLNYSSVKSKIKSYSTDLMNDMDKVGDSMQSGSNTIPVPQDKDKNGTVIIIIPEEAKNNPDMQTALAQIAQEIAEETGITVSFEYQDNALGG